MESNSNTVFFYNYHIPIITKLITVAYIMYVGWNWDWETVWEVLHMLFKQSSHRHGQRLNGILILQRSTGGADDCIFSSNLISSDNLSL